MALIFRFMNNLRLGIIGIGTVAQRDFLPFLSDTIIANRYGFNVTAVCDVDDENLIKAKEYFVEVENFNEYRNLLDYQGIDVAVILTPINTHFDIAKVAIRSKKHTYIQKPIATSKERADELILLAQEHGVKIGTSPSQMLDPYHILAKEIFRSGELGGLRYTRARATHVGHERQYTFEIDPSWYYSENGGPVYDVAIYPLHTLTSLIGPVRYVSSMGGISRRTIRWKNNIFDVNTEDVVIITLGFDNNVYGVIDCAFGVMGYGVPQFEFYFSEGSLNLGGWLQPEIPLSKYIFSRSPDALGERIVPHFDPYQNAPDRFSGLGIVRDLFDFLECIHFDKTPTLSLEQASHVVEVCEGIYRSMRLGKVQEIKSEFKTADDIDL